MTPMDLKSISWVGDMYQRIESLCVEVEENMYQDTVKYVEVQMQTVGASVKKFYSDVMHDLLHQSSLDTVKEENPPLNAATKKPKVINEKSVNTEAEQMMNDSADAANGDKIATDEPSSHDTVEEQCVSKDFQSLCAELDLPNLDICSSKDLDNREDSECNSPSDTSNLNPFMTKEFAHSEVQNESNEPLCQLVDASSESASVIEVSFNEEDEVGITKQITEGNGSETFVLSSGKRLPNLDGTSNALAASEIKRADADKQGVLLIKQLNKVNNLGESCVLVETFTVPREHKQRSYKKKIRRDVFTPWRWLKGKKDEEHHAVWYKEQDEKDSVTTMLKRASIKDNSVLCDESFESEWELL